MRLHHIGIATDDISEMEKWLNCVYKIREKSEIIYDKNQDANLCIYTMEDGTKIELISGNVVQRLVKKKNFLYHTCYEVDNLEARKKEFLNAGATIISDPQPAILFNNRRVMFLLTKIGIVELLEKK